MSSDRRRFRRVLVLTGDHGLADDTKWDAAYTPDDLVLHERMLEALRRLPGYSIDVLTEHARLMRRLADDPPEFVLNFCDTGFGNLATRELHVPALLEIHGIPYSGAPPAGMVLCYDKSVVRLIAASHDVPVPREILLPDARLPDRGAPFLPALIKPAQGDGSVGITRRAVVHDIDEARAYLDWFRTELPGRAALWQEFLSGTEYGLGLIGNPGRGFNALPMLQVDFGALPADCAPILAFESKTGPDNPYSGVRIGPADLAADTVARLRGHAELLFERLQCRDYARFDFRTDADGEIRLLEVNPNPAWSSAGKLALMAGFGGIGYTDLLGMILEAAQHRLS